MTRIYHLANSTDLAHAQAAGRYRCASLASEGFIHCCDEQQIRGVVERYYSQVDGLQLLVIEAEALDVELLRENTVGGTELFPHVYGEITMHAVVDNLPFGLTSAARLHYCG